MQQSKQRSAMTVKIEFSSPHNLVCPSYQPIKRRKGKAITSDSFRDSDVLSGTIKKCYDEHKAILHRFSECVHSELGPFTPLIFSFDSFSEHARCGADSREARSTGNSTWQSAVFHPRLPLYQRVQKACVHEKSDFFAFFTSKDHYHVRDGERVLWLCCSKIILSLWLMVLWNYTACTMPTIQPRVINRPSVPPSNHKVGPIKVIF